MSSRHRPMTAAEMHRAWLELVDTEGPFLAVPPLKRVWPKGMPQLPDEAKAALADGKPRFEHAWDAWHRAPKDEARVAAYRSARDEWVDTVLREVIGWGDLLVPIDSAGGAADARASSLDGRVTVRPTMALRHGDTIGALVWSIDPSDSLRDLADDGWASTPIDRMEQMLRSVDVPIGVVTDGRWWALVSAPPEHMAASGIVDAQTWIEEGLVRDAFAAILSRKQLVGGREGDRLPTLFVESIAAAEEITEALGVQVRRAVELLVQALSESATTAHGRGEEDPLPENPHEVYESAVTVMMRVVFLLFAEERDLLPEGVVFTSGYGMADRYDALRERAHDEGEESLDATSRTWHRLLATSRALHAGATFEDIRIPAYGGSLFDPARYPFLEALTDRGTLHVAVSDRVMLHVLEAVQVAHLRGTDARRISFRDIDVEQIGYIYEGLLGYTCVRAPEVTLGLIGSAGEEVEIPLSVLEGFAGEDIDDAEVAESVRTWAKEHQPGSKAPTKAAFTKGLRGTEEIDDAERALLAVTGDPALRAAVSPWLGVVRRDLRDRPLVVLEGGLLLAETPSRSTAGAHYTPKSLAEEVVRHALEPLVYRPGPHQTPDEGAWVPLSSNQILDLKVADIACGSGAFLVAAARYLAARLVEAWQRENVAWGSPRDLEIRATREVVAHCLYGADINGMAIEMCKLSLWLVSLDQRRPFSFVDDKVLHGNSLLGLTDLRQIERLHIDPTAGEEARLFDVGQGLDAITRLDVDTVVRRAKDLREDLASVVANDEPQRSATTKRRLWSEYQDVTAQLSHVADGVVAAGLALGGKPGKKLDEVYENLRIAVNAAFSETGEGDHGMLDGIIDHGLTPSVPTDYERWQPLHWCLAVPDVMERGGFDAVIGNPPFLGGQKLTGAMGTNVRDWFVNVLADGRRGSADLVAYFFLRATSLLNAKGDLGLIATNTVAQGDTREVGLDHMVDEGFTITRAIQSRSWPAASANLEYAAVWGTIGSVDDAATRVVDNLPVRRIATLLEPAGSVEGRPSRLAENAGIAFQGCIVLGMGFVLEPEEAQAWIDEDPKNAEVLFPYLNGEDLNSRPDCSPSRWVIDFTGFSEDDAAEYERPFERVLEQVKPDRMKNNRKVYRDHWWRYAEARPAMRRAIRNLDDLLAITITSRTLMPARVRNNQVFSHMLVVMASGDVGFQATLSSSVHQTWAVAYGSAMRGDSRYIPSDVFETFPRPVPTDLLAAIGKSLDVERREIMLRRDLGLTKLYNLVNDPDITGSSDADVARMREIHVELDRAVMAAYGWDDVPLGHGFHTYRQMQRWTVSPEARVEILDRLLEENHRRAATQDRDTTTTEDEEESA